MKYLLPVLLILTGCTITSENTARPENPWHSETTYHVDVVVGKYDRGTCMKAGGTWIVGDNDTYENALIGCIEKGKPQ